MGAYGSPELNQIEELKKGMIYCKICGKEIAKNAKACPNCGAKASRPLYKKWWFWIIIVVIIASASASSNPVDNTINTSGILDNNSPQVQEDTKTPIQKKEKFTLESHSGAYDSLGFAFYIEGTIRNNTDKDYSYVQVTFNTYDKDGAQLGTAFANISNLEANGIWRYKAMATADNIASYKLAEITGW